VGSRRTTGITTGRDSAANSSTNQPRRVAGAAVVSSAAVSSADVLEVIVAECRAEQISRWSRTFRRRSVPRCVQNLAYRSSVSGVALLLSIP
jgi:hypothetical protein